MFSCFFDCNQIVHWVLPQPDQTVKTMSIISKWWEVCDSRFIESPVLSLTSASCTMIMCPPTQHHPCRRNCTPTPNWLLSWKTPTSLLRFSLCDFFLSPTMKNRLSQGASFWNKSTYSKGYNGHSKQLARVAAGSASAVGNNTGIHVQL
jgi:hypothetical protein